MILKYGFTTDMLEFEGVPYTWDSMGFYSTYKNKYVVSKYDFVKEFCSSISIKLYLIFDAELSDNPEGVIDLLWNKRQKDFLPEYWENISRRSSLLQLFSDDFFERHIYQFDIEDILVNSKNSAGMSYMVRDCFSENLIENHMDYFKQYEETLVDHFNFSISFLDKHLDWFDKKNLYNLFMRALRFHESYIYSNIIADDFYDFIERHFNDFPKQCYLDSSILMNNNRFMDIHAKQFTIDELRNSEMTEAFLKFNPWILDKDFVKESK
jgi:hypothetical protein